MLSAHGYKPQASAARKYFEAIAYHSSTFQIQAVKVKSFELTSEGLGGL